MLFKIIPFCPWTLNISYIEMIECSFDVQFCCQFHNLYFIFKFKLYFNNSPIILSCFGIIGIFIKSWTFRKLLFSSRARKSLRWNHDLRQDFIRNQHSPNIILFFLRISVKATNINMDKIQNVKTNWSNKSCELQ